MDRVSERVRPQLLAVSINDDWGAGRTVRSLVNRLDCCHIGGNPMVSSVTQARRISRQDHAQYKTAG
jgi:hypothetical protein